MAEVTHEVQVASPIPEPDIPVNPTHSIWLPISKEIAEALRINKTAHVEFDGMVTEISNDGFGIETNNHNVRLDVQRVKITHENEFEEMAREMEDDDDGDM